MANNSIFILEPLYNSTIVQTLKPEGLSEKKSIQFLPPPVHGGVTLLEFFSFHSVQLLKIYHFGSMAILPLMNDWRIKGILDVKLKSVDSQEGVTVTFYFTIYYQLISNYGCQGSHISKNMAIYRYR